MRGGAKAPPHFFDNTKQKESVMALNRLKKGQRVYWNDPDNATSESDCSGAGTITAIVGEIISVDKDDGGQVEAFAHELSTLETRFDGSQSSICCQRPLSKRNYGNVIENTV